MASQTRFGTDLCILFLILAITTETQSSNYLTSMDIFNGHFYREAVSQNEDGDLVVSALSAEMLFSMLATGAEGETKEEILNSLFLQNIDSEAPSIKDIIKKINKTEGVTLNMANKIYAKPGTSGDLDSVRPSYRYIIQNIFNGDIQQVDFSRNVEAAKEISGWVYNKTNHQIEDFISEDSIDGLTAGVLVNAIYFKGKWAIKFHRTDSHKFYGARGSTTTVKMMHAVGKYLYKYSAELDAQIILLPYENQDLSMLVILPNQKNGIRALEAKLLNGTIQYLGKLDWSHVKLSLPKFKIENTIDVKSIMSKLGVNRVFTRAAELKGVLKEDSGFSVSKAVQKAFIEVNEEGAEAGVASGARVISRSGKFVQFQEFNADHPFYFAVLKSKSIILFSGTKKH